MATAKFNDGVIIIAAHNLTHTALGNEPFDALDQVLTRMSAITEEMIEHYKSQHPERILTATQLEEYKKAPTTMPKGMHYAEMVHAGNLHIRPPNPHTVRKDLLQALTTARVSFNVVSGFFSLSREADDKLVDAIKRYKPKMPADMNLGNMAEIMYYFKDRQIGTEGRLSANTHGSVKPLEVNLSILVPNTEVSAQWTPGGKTYYRVNGSPLNFIDDIQYIKEVTKFVQEQQVIYDKAHIQIREKMCQFYTSLRLCSTANKAKEKYGNIVGKSVDEAMDLYYKVDAAKKVAVAA